MFKQCRFNDSTLIQHQDVESKLKRNCFKGVCLHEIYKCRDKDFNIINGLFLHFRPRNNVRIKQNDCVVDNKYMTFPTLFFMKITVYCYLICKMLCTGSLVTDRQ